MKIETALNHKIRVLSAIESMVYAAKVSSITSAQFNEDAQAVFDTISHCPRWVRDYCQGYLDCERNRIQRDLIGGGFIDGVFYSTHSNRDDYYAKHGIEPRAWAEKYQGGQVKDSGLYWAQSLKLWFK